MMPKDDNWNKGDFFGESDPGIKSFIFDSERLPVMPRFDSRVTFRHNWALETVRFDNRWFH